MPASSDHRPPWPAIGPRDQSAGSGLHSALPNEAFGSHEPSVEDALLASARQVFLRHMAATNEREPTLPDSPDSMVALSADDDLSPDELRACVDEIAGLGRIEPPDLLAGLPHERVWILMHMARHGAGLCRQRATQEMRATLRKVSESPKTHRELLATLADRLTDMNNNAGTAPIFQALLHEVRDAIARASLATDDPR